MEETMMNNTIDTMVTPDIPAVEDYNSSLMTNPTLTSMTPQEAMNAATGSFTWKEGVVLTAMVVGGAAIVYSGYDLIWKKLIKGVIVPKVQENKAMKEAMKAGEQNCHCCEESED